MTQGEAIREEQVAGRRFRYSCGGRAAARMTLRADHRLEGAPSIHEHAWEIEGGKLVLRHRNGQRTVEFTAAGRGKFRGVDLTATQGGEAWLIERKRSPLSGMVRSIKYALFPKKRPQPVVYLPDFLLQNSIGIRIGKKTIRWVFQYTHDRGFLERYILPWALPGHERISPSEASDFVVGVYLEERTIRESFAELKGRKFLLSGEMESRHPRLPECFSFVQGPQAGDDANYIRYSPTLCLWVPPVEAVKKAKCSVVDNGQYVWRAEMIADLAKRIGGVDIFGKLSGRALGGYHKTSGSDVGNDKYLGIQEHCFYLALERAVADDYITEKFCDAILCNAVPIYDGAPNIDVYAVPGSYLLSADVEKVDWNNWREEYERRLPVLKRQKEFIRTHLNLFGYFHHLTEDMSLLDQKRPITLQTAGDNR